MNGVAQLLWRHVGRGHEPGQMLLVFAMLVVPVTLVMGVLAVDVSLWQSERRGAQKDADLVALAGAQQLLHQDNDPDDVARVTKLFANANDDSGSADPLPEDISIGAQSDDEPGVAVSDACFPGNDVIENNTVEVNLRHETPVLFSGAFNIEFLPEIGAHARACVGSIIATGAAAGEANATGFGMIDLLPIVIDNDDGDCFENDAIDYDDSCELQYGSNPCTNPLDGLCMRYSDDDFRTVDLVESETKCSAYAGGTQFQADGFLENQIRNGAEAFCLLDDDEPPECEPDAFDGPWADCVTIRAVDPHDFDSSDSQSACREPGETQRNDWCDIMDAMRERIGSEDDCGLDGMEAVEQVAGSGNSPRLYEAVECPKQPGEVSPRLATIFVVEELPSDRRQNYYATGLGDREGACNENGNGGGNAGGNCNGHEDEDDKEDAEEDRRRKREARIRPGDPEGRRDEDNEGFDVRALATVYIESCYFQDTDFRTDDGLVEVPGKWHDDCRHVKGADLVRIRVRFVRLLTQGEIGPPDESATAVGIALGE